MMSIKSCELDRCLDIAYEIKKMNEIKEFLDGWCKRHNRLMTGRITIKNKIGEYNVDITLGGEL